MGWWVLQLDSPGLPHAAILSQQVGWGHGIIWTGSLSPDGAFLSGSLSYGGLRAIPGDELGGTRPPEDWAPEYTYCYFCHILVLEGNEGRKGGRRGLFLPVFFLFPSAETLASQLHLVPSFSPLPDPAWKPVLQSSFPRSLIPNNSVLPFPTSSYFLLLTRPL